MHQSPSSQPARTPDGRPNCGQWSLQEAALQPSMVIKATMITMVTERSGIIWRAKSSIRGGGWQRDNMCHLRFRQNSSELDNGHKALINMLHSRHACPVKIHIQYTCAYTHIGHTLSLLGLKQHQSQTMNVRWSRV